MKVWDGAAWVNTGGKILQVVSTAKTDTFTIASTTFADVTGLSATITPGSSSSKVFVLVTINAGSNAGTVAIRGRLLRDSTNIAIGDTAGSRTSVTFSEVSSSFDLNPLTMNFLDSPATTSAVTYKIQVSGNTANTVAINRSVSDADADTNHRGISTITLMEVAG